MNDEKCFLFHVQSSFCCQDIHIFDFGYIEKQLGKKAKVNFKMYDVTAASATNNYNTCIV